MDFRQGLGHRRELVRQARCLSLDEVDDQRTARQAGLRCHNVMQARRAPGRLKKAEGFGLHGQARGGHRIALMGIGNARQPSVAQAHMTVRRAGRRQRLTVLDVGERGLRHRISRFWASCLR